ncbi:MAG: PfkB family carbohydrate kinase [Desulfobacterota bacterium]|nr:PfkB family carbohydrate kinase [Thermodesulfobacteriota bacterium]
MTLTRRRLDTLLQKFPDARIMVVGDIMLDEYLTGTVERISPEAPIPVVNLHNHKTPDLRLGGAANVLHNLAALGNTRALLCGIVGNDESGRAVKRALKRLGVTTRYVYTVSGRPTTVKTRIIAHGQQVIRIDREDRSPPTPHVQARIAGAIMKHAPQLDAIIFSDYEKGVITKNLLSTVLPQLNRYKNLIIAVDPKFSNFTHFKNVTIIVPNRKEASGFLRHEIVTDHDALVAARNILANLSCRYVLIKLGEHGMRLVDRNGSDIRIETAAEQVYDVTGAGDTVISTLVLARVAGATWEEAARIANVAAGRVIHYIGTSTITAAQLRNAMVHYLQGSP